MAAGEYTSVASQRELVLAELDVERQQLLGHPVDEMEELAELYVSRGVTPALAREVAMQLSRDPDQALEIHAREEGPPPAVDLHKEKRNGDFIRHLICQGRVTACHDISDGGLLVALAEMALSAMRGALIAADGNLDHIGLFAEDQARYVVTCRPGETALLLADARAAGVEAVRLGTVQGSALIVGGVLSISLDELKLAHEGWFPAFMEG